MGETLGPEGRLLSEQAVSDLAHALKHAGPAQVLETLRAVVAAHPELPELAPQLAYLEKREGQLQYPQFQAASLPIGSGSVESAHTVVVEARLNGAGMRWAREHVNPMLALRNAVCNDRWDEVWGQIEAEQRRQVGMRRRARRQQRAVAAIPPTRPEAAPLAALPVPPPLPEPDLQPCVPVLPPSPVGSSAPRRPAADHPWRRAWSRRRQMEEALAA